MEVRLLREEEPRDLRCTPLRFLCGQQQATKQVQASPKVAPNAKHKSQNAKKVSEISKSKEWTQVVSRRALSSQLPCKPPLLMRFAEEAAD
mmetsp:Transcript_11343/g.19939  ORF Transcript_11343/g.19939 Transcript_11343/m.19939 type:complete len:91 (-) Transcript_11343:167-439(-)